MTTFSQLEGILSSTSGGIIGIGDIVPWAHTQNLHRFYHIADKQAILVSYNKFLIMAKESVASGRKILPGGEFFVIGSANNVPGNQYLDINKSLEFELKKNLLLEFANLGISVNTNQIHIVIPTRPIDDIREILGQLEPETKLLIVGGTAVYDRYLMYANRIHLTIIDDIIGDTNNEHLVRLTSDTTALLFTLDKWNVQSEGRETDEGLQARFFVLNRINYSNNY